MNRPGVAGAVLQTPSTFINSSCSSQSSKHCLSQTVKARELKFWENVHPPPFVKCHMSHVTCHMSCVRCHVSDVTCHLSHVTCHTSCVPCNYCYYFFYTRHVTADTWHVTSDMWHVTCDKWHMTQDKWHMTHDKWHVTHDNVTRDMWRKTHERFGEVDLQSNNLAPYLLLIRSEGNTDLLCWFINLISLFVWTASEGVTQSLI